ncbi:MAG: hypothetical protein KY466_03880 [Gemmatimonadetes bacterium]|nr:hypothetical protein [Gemmatimonadota bacterium]
MIPKTGAVLLALTLLGCEPPAGRGAAPEVARAAAPVAGDTTFAGLVAALSEPAGYFDTDNLISNESSYLHVLGALDSLGVRGGAYIGVGPDQNFSYIAAVRPSIAFIIDIRRHNLLQHLWLRALFEAAPTRLGYLCLMVARRCGGPSDGLSAEALATRVDAAPPLPDRDRAIERVLGRAAAYGVPLEADDSAAIRSIHRRFADAGLDLRFNTHGRAPRPYYPTLRGLLLERDLDGRRASYLADEAAYAFVRGMEVDGRVVPVVGDLAGPHAVRAIGDAVRSKGEVVSAFYVSNVEFYLFGDGTFRAFIENLAALPADRSAVLIRSVFRARRSLPGSVPGYASTQLLHGVPALLRAWEQGRITSYAALVEASVRD